MLNEIVRPAHLAPRQEQILVLACEGLTDKEIAARTGLSVSTLRTYWERLRTRYEAATRGEVIAKAALSAFRITSAELESCRAVLDGVQQFLWTALPSGEVDYVNAWFGTYSGLGEDHLLGQGCKALMPEQELSDSTGRWKHAQETAGAYSAVVHFRNGVGQYEPHQIWLTPLRTVDGAVSKWVGRAHCLDGLLAAA